MEYFNNLMFGYYPYICGAVFLLGSLVRFDMSQYTWRSGSSQVLHSTPGFRVAINLFHVGIILLFFGHLFGLLTPPVIYHALGISTSVKQVASMTVGGILGVMILIGGGYLLWRRLCVARVRATSSPMDTLILIIIYVQLLLGLGTIWISTGHLDGGTMLHLTGWAQRIVTFRPGAAGMLLPVHWIYKAHIVLGLTIFLLFPFSRLVHIWSMPYAYVFRRYQIVRQRGSQRRA